MITPSATHLGRSPFLGLLVLATLCSISLRFAGAQVVIDGNLSDWDQIGSGGGSMEVSVDDPADLPDTSGDIRRISATVDGADLVLSMTVEGTITPTVEQTPDGKTNRYYYHWIIDTDNDPATGFSNAEYEGTPTNLETPLGADMVIQIGWRDGAPNGVYAYDAVTEEEIVVDYSWSASGATATARIPLETLGFVEGQTIALSAFQEGASDDWMVDWMESTTLTIPASSGPEAVAVDDPDDLPDDSGDIRRIEAYAANGALHLAMMVEGVFAPSVEQTPDGATNRYYYHWLIDTDDDPATGFSNAEYEGAPTNLANPIGAEVVVQLGWRDGAPNGVYAYDAITEEELIVDFEWSADGSRADAVVPLEALGLTEGQTVALSAFQEGASNDWMVDWIESTPYTIPASTGGETVSVDDPDDLPDDSGDIRRIEAYAAGDSLHLAMLVQGVFAPSVDQTPDGGVNRYYYHWILDVDDNPATGFSNAEYEGTPTNLETPIGADVVVQIGWRDGAPNGVYAYDAVTEEELIVDFEWSADGSRADAVVPLAALGLSAGQTLAVSAFQEGASNDWMVDWIESTTMTIPAGNSAPIAEVNDPTDDLPDPSGDLARIQAAADAQYLYLGMQVEGVFAPSVEQTPEGKTNRYYYHWLLDTDNDPATGFSNAEYEGTPTNLANPIGAEVVVQIGWRDGAPNGVYAYDAVTEEDLVVDYEWASDGSIAEAKILLADLGLTVGQTIALSAFQEGASDDWMVDWMESVEMTLAPPTGNIDLTTFIDASAYGHTVYLENQEGATLVPDSVKLIVNGATLESTISMDGDVTVVSATNSEWLPQNTQQRLRIEYQIEEQAAVQSREFPFEVPAYTVVPTFYGADEVDQEATGFLVTTTQISEAQADGESYHGNNADLAERQFQGLATSRDGQPFDNEAGTPPVGWNLTPVPVDGVINWNEAAPAETGHFRQSNGRTDMDIPGIPGSEGSYNGIVTEILAYLDLEPGFHRFAVNTVTGYKASIGPDGRDQLAPVIDAFSGDVNYSSFGDHFFSILVEEPGYYPVRLLWFHAAPTDEGAQLEFYSVKNKKRILINDPDDPDAIKAYRASPASVPYVSTLSPGPDEHFAAPDSRVEISINQEGAALVPGSLALKFDGMDVTPQITQDGTVTHVTYNPGPLAYGSTHEVELSYEVAGDPPFERRESYTFGVYDQAAILSTDWVTPVGTEGPQGFQVRTVQSFSPRSNSTVAAEAQLAGAGDFSANGTVDVLNLSLGDEGLFSDDFDMIGEGLVSGASTDYFSMEAIAYLYLPIGVHTFGVNSDDGFLVTAGKSPTEETVELAKYEGGRGTDSNNPQDLFDVIVQEEGLYAFRLVWYQGTGGASFEWYSYDRATGEAILVNHPENPDAIRAYQSRTEEPSVKPGPNIAVTPDYEFRRIPKSQTSESSTFSVLNSGNANALTITEARFTGPDATHFSVGSGFPVTIDPKETGGIDLTFTHGGNVGTFTATLEIVNDDAEAADQLKTVEVVANVYDPRGPIARYALDEAEGTEMHDRSGYRRTGSYVAGEGAVSLGEAALAGGTSAHFAGGAYAQVEGRTLGAWSESFSISTWVVADSAGGTQMIFGRSNPNEDNPEFALLLTDGTLNWFVGATVELASDGPVITAGTTHHLGVAYRHEGEGGDNFIAIYVDGTEVARSDNPALLRLGTGTNLYLASLRGILPFAGTLDEFQIYDEALDGEDFAYLQANPTNTLGDRDPVVDPGDDLPVIADVALTEGGAIRFTFTVGEGSSVDVEYSESMETGTWQVIASDLTGTQVFEETDAGRLANPQGYYRLHQR